MATKLRVVRMTASGQVSPAGVRAAIRQILLVAGSANATLTVQDGSGGSIIAKMAIPLNSSIFLRFAPDDLQVANDVYAALAGTGAEAYFYGKGFTAE